MPNKTAVRITGFHPPGGPGTERAHTGRIASYLLGQKDHFAADRAAGDMIRSGVPGAAGLLRAGRAFQQRVVRAMTAVLMAFTSPIPRTTL